jgi:hypothetical protein
MLARTGPVPTGRGWAVEVKFDGMHLQLRRDRLQVVSERINRWSRNAVFGGIGGAHVGAPLGFFAEHWRPAEEDPHYPALAARYGEGAVNEVGTLRFHLLREVVYAASGFAYTLDKLEALLEEVQTWVEEELSA